ncbi:hypothetical protein V5O48_007697 [Marasmius crinis-equi]|uniref:Uncharacterized protein n=1 Tax=Marasmius crinis-equi TaxID=585013 RepID=A0ABR3FG09_9AGAR
MPKFIPDDVWYSILQDPSYFDGNAEYWERAVGRRPQTRNIAASPGSCERIHEVIVGYPNHTVPQMGSGNWTIRRMNDVLATFSSLVSLSIVKTVFPVIAMLELLTNLDHLENLSLDNVISPCENWGVRTSESLYTEEGHTKLPQSLKTVAILGEYKFSRWYRSVIPILILLSSPAIENLTLDPYALHSIFNVIADGIVTPSPITYSLPIHGTCDTIILIRLTPSLRTLIIRSFGRMEWGDDWHTPFRTSAYAKTLLKGLKETVVRVEVHGYVGGHNGGGNVTMRQMTEIVGPLHFDTAFLNRGHVVRSIIANSWVRNYDSFSRLMDFAVPSPTVETFHIPILHGNLPTFIKIVETFPNLRNLYMRLKSSYDYQKNLKKFGKDVLRRLPHLEVLHLHVEDLPQSTQVLDEAVDVWKTFAPNLKELRLDPWTVKRRVEDTQKWSTARWEGIDITIF